MELYLPLTSASPPTPPVASVLKLSIVYRQRQMPGALGTRKLGFGALPSTAKFCHLKEVCGLLCDSAPPSVEGEGRELPPPQLCRARTQKSEGSPHERGTPSTVMGRMLLIAKEAMRPDL